MKFTGERCIIGKSGKCLEKRHLDRYKFALSYTKNKVVLDIACGTGFGSKILAKNSKKVIGIDISNESITYAKQNFSLRNINFIRGDATNLKFLENKSIDVVVSFETLEHLSRYKQFLSEIKRVLKSKGILIISTPNKKYSSPNSPKPINPFHVVEFYLEEFKALISNYFSEISMFGQDLQTFSKRLKEMMIKYSFPILSRIVSKEKIEKYRLDQISGVTNKGVIDCLYLIAVCQKNKT